jgi:FMN phosphatase YigB (HAD superfamily)
MRLSLASIIFDINDVLVAVDNSAGFSGYLAKKAEDDRRINTQWSGDVKTVLFGLLTKYCPLCEFGQCAKFSMKEPGRHVTQALKEGTLTYEGCKVAMTYMMTHYVECSISVRIVLDHAIDYYSRPDMLMHTCAVISEGMQLFDYAVKKFGAHHVFILSNMPIELFSLFKKQFPQVIQAIPAQNIVLAGHGGVVKPERKVFELMIQRVGGSAASMILIDDKERNIVGARQCGMRAVQFSRKPSPELVAFYKEIGFNLGC